MYSEYLIKPAVLISTLLLLTACGGSSNNEQTPANIAPTISVSDVTSNEKTNITISASASDSDGEIAKYQWEVVSNHSLILSGDNTEKVTFVAPAVGFEGDTVKFTLTVTDNRGATTSKTVSAFIKPITTTITLKGITTSPVLSNANIEARIQRIDTTTSIAGLTDDEGNYSLDVVLDEDETALVAIVAKGIEQQNQSGLISIIGETSDIITNAGDDNILTKDENFAVVTSSITTAQYALAKIANSNQEITTKDELVKHYSQINAYDILALATSLQVIADKTDSNTALTLPEGITNTIELIDNPQALAAYVEQVKSTPEYEDANAKILSNKKLENIYTSFEVPENLYSLATDLYIGNIYQFEPSNEGAISAYATNQLAPSYTWSQTPGVITLDMTSGNSIRFYEAVEGESGTYSVSVKQTNTSRVLTRLTSSLNSNLYKHTYTSLTEYPNGEFESFSKTSKRLITLRTGLLSENTPLALTSGVAYMTLQSYPIESEIRDGIDTSTLISADKIQLNIDNSCYAHAQNKSCTWSLDNNQLMINFPEQEHYKFKQVAVDDAVDQFAQFTIDPDGSEQISSIGRSRIISAPIPWKMEQVPGIYSYQNSAIGSSTNRSWFELLENGDAHTISTFDKNNDGKIDPENEMGIYYWNWNIVSESKLVISRKQGRVSSACKEPNPDAGCALYNTKTWEKIGSNGKKLGIFQKEQFHFSLHSQRARDVMQFDNRIIYKLEQRPVAVEIPAQ